MRIRRDALAGRAWRLHADTRRRLRRRNHVREVIDSFGVTRRTTSWTERLSEGHERYRSAWEPIVDRATVVCVSRRPRLIADVIENIRRQSEIEVELVLVTNDAGFADIDLQRHLAPLQRAIAVERSPSDTLGACLNAGFAMAQHRFVAKFDDDDWYGSGFLADSLRAHNYADAAVVGKHSYYADVGAPSHRFLRFPGREFSLSSTLAGGTLVIDRERTGSLTFDDVSIGEDRSLLRACHRRGLSTFSADRFNFVQRRTGDNTWAVSDATFLEGCVPADPADPTHLVER